VSDAEDVTDDSQCSLAAFGGGRAPSDGDGSPHDADALAERVSENAANIEHLKRVVESAVDAIDRVADTADTTDGDATDSSGLLEEPDHLPEFQ